MCVCFFFLNVGFKFMELTKYYIWKAVCFYIFGGEILSGF